MPRLPAKYRTRPIFALTALIGGMAFGFLYAFILFGFSLDMLKDCLMSSLFGLPAGPAAWICWPRKNRSSGRMVGAALLTVVLAFCLIGIFSALHMFLGELADGKFKDAILLAGLVLISMPVFGSLITWGIPYLIGIFIAMLFADTKA